MSSGAQSFFGLSERPFSLTPDARYHFRSRAHARALGGLSTGLARGAPLLLLIGDLGTGKSTLCRALARASRPDRRIVHFANALLSPVDLYRGLLQDLGAREDMTTSRRRVAEATGDELRGWLATVLAGNAIPPLMFIDEAHLLPASTVDAVVDLVSCGHGAPLRLQAILASQPSSARHPALEEAVAYRARLTPLDRDELEPFIQHRLHVAGGAPIGISPRTIDVLYGLSGGVPRLVNLLCERALQEAAIRGITRLEPSMFEAAASALDLLRLRSRRFRWFSALRGAAAV